MVRENPLASPDKQAWVGGEIPYPYDGSGRGHPLVVCIQVQSMCMFHTYWLGVSYAYVSNPPIPYNSTLKEQEVW